MSEEDTVDAEQLALPDFPPFMASFRQYKKDLTVEAKQSIMTKKACLNLSRCTVNSLLMCSYFALEKIQSYQNIWKSAQ